MHGLRSSSIYKQGTTLRKMPRHGKERAEFEQSYLVVIWIIADMLEDVLVRNNVEGAKDDDDGDVLLNIRKGGTNILATGASITRGTHHLDLERGSLFGAFVDGRANL